MNIAKNMEIIFLSAVALIAATGFATAAVPAKHIAEPAAIVAKADAKMPVVVVSAKRLTAAEKAAL
ncbi:hypothetical protein [Pseudoduganella sp. RAF53_2]|uniref:hypothetical protein n=1 Tax=unclassified Pseudoduganella TaxID=2637179 RepID=UPI003F95F6D2